MFGQNRPKSAITIECAIYQQCSNSVQLKLDAKKVIFGFITARERNKHCQRHNGPRVLSLKLELSFQIYSPVGATWIDYKFCHQMAPLTLALYLVPNLTTRWRYLCWFQIWAPAKTPLGYHIMSLALVLKLATRLCHLHCHIALDCLLAFNNDNIGKYWVCISQSQIS